MATATGLGSGADTAVARTSGVITDSTRGSTARDAAHGKRRLTVIMYEEGQPERYMFDMEVEEAEIDIHYDWGTAPDPENPFGARWTLPRALGGALTVRWKQMTAIQKHVR